MRYETQLPYMEYENDFYAKQYTSVAWELYELSQREYDEELAQCSSEWRSWSNEEIFKELEYQLNEERDHSPTCEEEYDLYLGDCERLELKRWDMYTISDKELHFQEGLVKHFLYKKKRKHIKDKKYTRYEKSPLRVEGYELGDRYSAYEKNITHKHKRAERVYLEDEYFDDRGQDYGNGTDEYFIDERGNRTYYDTFTVDLGDSA